MSYDFFFLCKYYYTMQQDYKEIVPLPHSPKAGIVLQMKDKDE